MRTKIAPSSSALLKAFDFIFELHSFLVGMPFFIGHFLALPSSLERGTNQYEEGFLKTNIAIAPPKNFLFTYNSLKAQQ